jgi:hypothetical protein
MSSTVSSANTSIFPNYLPLLTPSLKGDTCIIDDSIEHKRMKIISTIALAILALPLVFPANLLIVVTSSLFSLIVFPLLPLDLWLTEKAANSRAVNEYLAKKLPPSKEATRRIHNSVSALKLLINLVKNSPSLDIKEVINRTDINGYRLLSLEPKFSVFKLLIDNGADVRLSNKGEYSEPYYLDYLTDESFDYLEYLLSKKILSPENCSPKEQQKLWLSLQGKKAAELLKQYNFNVNIEHEGMTSLQKLGLDKSKWRSHKYLDFDAHVEILIHNGAHTKQDKAK